MCKKFIKKKINLALAGGVFANVKLNQKIKDLKNIKDIFVFPNMGDGGLAVGCAQLCYYNKTKKIPKKINNVYFGYSFSDKETINTIKKNKLNFYKSKFIEKEIAEFLVKDKVVAHFNSSMEFGPRALGNRSILCSAKDPAINKTLNKKLGRTEFMPFAPIILDKFAKDYLNINNELGNYKYMTITCYCKPLMISKAPASVHVDKTARPQIVSQKENRRLYKILSEYYKLSGVPVLINTSFNMHEEPIVFTPEDAIRAFLDGNLDYLIINNFVIQK